MMFLKYLCCKETLSAQITTGEIKILPHYPTSMLEVHISITMGSIIPSTDFLYLQPQVEQVRDMHTYNGKFNGTGGGTLNSGTAPTTAGSTMATNTSQHHHKGSNTLPISEQKPFGGPEDREPLPRRLRDVKKDRVILIEKGSALCENVGLAYIDFMHTEKGRYKLYFMRIDGEQRIMFNSRLEILGSSNVFSISNVIQNGPSEFPLSDIKPNRVTLKDIIGESQQDGSHKRKDAHHIQIGGGGESFNDSSDLDSLILMHQIQGGGTNGGTFISNSQSVHSSDQTQYFNQSPNSKCNSGRGVQPLHTRSIQEYKSLNSSQVNSSSQFSCGSSTVTYIVKNENDEAMIVTQSRIGNPGALTNQSLSKHRRGINIQSVLDDISSSKYTNKSQQSAGSSSRNSKEALTQAKYRTTQEHAVQSKTMKHPGSNKKVNTKTMQGGKENKSETVDTQKRYLNASLSQSIKGMPQMKKVNLNIDSENQPNDAHYHHYFYDRESYDAEHNLNIRYVTDIESISAPRFNPDTRTYFKCSIYSPSNRLYTVNEEVNSTQSDAGAGEQFSSSLLNSGLRKSSNHRGGQSSKLSNILRNSGNQIIPFPDRIMDEFTNGNHFQIDEEDENDDETGNVSETNSSPPPSHLRLHEKKSEQLFSSSGGHTRTNSSKAQSLKGSIILQKPALSSHFSSSIVLPSITNSYGYPVNSGKRGINLPTSNESRRLQQIGQNTNTIRVHECFMQDIEQYIQQMPGSFVCTGGTEFHHDSNRKKQTPEQGEMTQRVQIRTGTTNTLENTVIKNPSTMSEKYEEDKCIEDSKSSIPFSPHNLNEDSSSVQSATAYFEDSNRKKSYLISGDHNYHNNPKSSTKFDESPNTENSLNDALSHANNKNNKKMKPPAIKRNFSPVKSAKVIGLKNAMAQSKFQQELTKKRYR